jgi:hypothetical protein
LKLYALASLFVVASSPSLFAFGDKAHQVVTDRAIDTLPKGLKPFYKAHRLEMPTLALEGEPPSESTDRRFAIDRLQPFPFADVPHTEAALKTKYGDTGAAAGRLPWLIQESYAKLVDAFKSADKTRILEESDRLAALVTDLHNPLALTDNADGQKTEQHGLWQRFSVKLPEAMGKDLDLNPEAAFLLDKPDEHVFSMMNGTYIWADNLLYEEDIAHRGHSGYGERYFEGLSLRAGRLLKERLSKAAGEAGSYWYTAWSAAGRPDLK